MIRADEIDILVDLSGHTGGNRLGVFARKPAPIQATWLGYLCTTGLASMDYRICDRYTDPPGATDLEGTEALAVMPDSQWCYRPYISSVPAAIPPSVRNGFVTFGSFNQFGKVSPSIRSIWAEILGELPQARLLVVGVPRGRTQDEFRESFSESGVSADRIQMVDRVPLEEYYQLFNRVDIALDTMPYSGGTTTCDALWMSVPVITLAGKHPVARSGASLLATAGFPDLIAQSSKAYVEMAVELARDASALADFRRGIREQMRRSPLMDEPKFVRELEQIYRRMWCDWCESGLA
jgi:predicted O-linked N-acetylglucosamine transferase (SPINDLY family)